MSTNRLRPAAVLLLAASLFAGQPADWNAVKALAPGTEVRIDAAPRKLSGLIRSVSDDAVVVRADAGDETVARSQVRRVAMKKQGRRKRNALIGLGVGAGVGTGFALAETSCKGFNCLGAEIVEIGAPLVFAIAGTIVGALLPTGGWRDIYRAP